MYLGNLSRRMVETDPEATTLRVKRATKARLQAHGQMSESFDDLLNRVLDEYERGARRARR